MANQSQTHAALAATPHAYANFLAPPEGETNGHLEETPTELPMLAMQDTGKGGEEESLEETRAVASPAISGMDHFREVTDMMGKEGKDGKVSAPPEGETNVRSHHHSPDDSSPASADVGGELQAEAAVASPTMSAAPAGMTAAEEGYSPFPDDYPSTEEWREDYYNKHAVRVDEELFECLMLDAYADHLRGLQPCATNLYRQGFEAAHELRECGHSRGDYRDPKYGTPEYDGDEQCVGCQREAHLREEVARLTRECLGRDCDVCGAELPAEKWRQCAACTEKAEAELARLRERVRWIPVEEKLPEDGRPTLIRAVYTAGPPWPILEMGHYIGQWYGVSEARVVTHWMPLPDAPAARAALESTTPQEEK